MVCRVPPARCISILCLAGVLLPLADTDGFRLNPPPLSPPVAAAARSADACETPLSGAACDVVVTLPAWLTLVPGVFMLLVLTEELDRCRREGVGWFAPVIWCIGLGSEMSIGRRELLAAEVEDMDDALLATEADCARNAVSSLVRRLTCL